MKDSKVVILGNGQFARALARRRPTRNTVLLSRLFNDVTNTIELKRLIAQLNPDFVINGAAYNSVGQAETREGFKQATAVNHLAVEGMCDACESVGAKLVHICTNYVFDGEKDSPYTEEDEAKPIGLYGQTKLAGTQLALARGHLVFRTSAVWSRNLYPDNFAAWVEQQLRTGQPFTVDNRQKLSFCRVHTLVDAVQHSITNYVGTQGEQWPTGLYNVVDTGETTWYKFAVQLTKAVGRDPALIIPGVRDDDVPRPMRSSLDTTKTQKYFGAVLGSWQHSLARYKDYPFNG